MTEERPTRLRSRVAVDGLDRTPHRAFLRGMGLDHLNKNENAINQLTDKGMAPI